MVNCFVNEWMFTEASPSAWLAQGFTTRDRDSPRLGNAASSVPCWCRIDCRIGLYPGVDAAQAPKEISDRLTTFAHTDPFMGNNPRTRHRSWGRPRPSARDLDRQSPQDVHDAGLSRYARVCALGQDPVPLLWPDLREHSRLRWTRQPRLAEARYRYHGAFRCRMVWPRADRTLAHTRPRWRDVKRKFRQLPICCHAGRPLGRRWSAIGSVFEGCAFRAV